MLLEYLRRDEESVGDSTVVQWVSLISFMQRRRSTVHS